MPHLRQGDVQYRTGSLPFALASLVRTVTFDTPMPNADYKLYYSATGISVNASITNKTATGFTITVGISIGSLTLDWIAIENR